jgi:hypothetical protein
MQFDFNYVNYFFLFTVNTFNLFFAVKNKKDEADRKLEIEEEIREIESRHYSLYSSFSGNREIQFESLKEENKKANSCYYYSESPFLACAIDPELNCSDCKDFRKIN